MLKLRTRLTLFYAAITALALLGFGLVGYAVEVAAESLEAEPQEEKDRELAEFRGRMLVVMGGGLPVAVLIAFAGAWWMTRRTFQVVDDVVQTTGGLSVEDLAARVAPPHGAGQEMERLVNTLNAMLERLERSTTGLRRFTADAAHELRTPMAVLMGRLEASLTGASDRASLLRVQEETLAGLESLNRLVDTLLMLARSDAGALRVDHAAVSLRELCHQVAEPYVELAAARNITVAVTRSDEVIVQTDALLVGRALSNLLDNAVKFTAAGGQVTIALTSDAGGARVTVEDTGPGLTAEDEERVFTRFYRSNQAQGTVPGSGLGLALTREFIHAVGGQVGLCNRPTGGGARATIHLPGSAVKA